MTAMLSVANESSQESYTDGAMQPRADVRRAQELIQSGMLPADRLRLASGQVIFRPNDPADRCFLIESGEVHFFHEISARDLRMLDILGPGDWLGTAALGELPVYGKRAVTAAPSMLWAMPADLFRQELLNNAELAVQVLQGISLRLQQAWNDGSELAFKDCRHRLIKTLLRFSCSSAARPAPDGISLHITHAQLAQVLGVARETVSICLTELRQHKIICTGRNRLTFDPMRLREMNVR